MGTATTVTTTTVQSGGKTVTAVALGSSVTDQATVSGTGAGTPTGTVTFTLFSNSTCSGTGGAAGKGTLASGVANSSSQGPLTAGAYSFEATYSGDSNYQSSVGGCEPFTVNQAVSQTVTTVQSGGQTVTAVSVGSSVTDQATVSGTGAGTPTGTVTFTFYSNGTCSGTGSPAGTGTLASGVATSSSEGSLTAGSYSFEASYGGDANYLSSTGSCEPLTVNAPVLSITKTADATSVPAGSNVGFTITVSNSGTAGTATNVTLNDPLPSGSGINWSISPAYGGPGTCAISGSVGSQVLSCSFGNLAPGASATVHISSGTSSTCNVTLKNTATASATNAPSVSASATIVVTPSSPPQTSLSESGSVDRQGSWTTVTFTYKEKNTGNVGITGSDRVRFVLWNGHVCKQLRRQYLHSRSRCDLDLYVQQDHQQSGTRIDLDHRQCHRHRNRRRDRAAGSAGNDVGHREGPLFRLNRPCFELVPRERRPFPAGAAHR